MQVWNGSLSKPAGVAQASRFGIDERFIAYLAVLCNAVYVPGSWLCTWLLRSHGLAKVLGETEFGNVVGEWPPFMLSCSTRTLLGTSASLLVTSALLVVTRSY